LIPLEISEDVLDQDHGRIYDDAEIDRPNRQQVRAFTPNDEQNRGEEQRERYVQTYNDSAAEIPQENPLDQENQDESEDEVVQDRLGRHRDQRRPVVKRNDLHSRRQASVVIQIVNRRFDLGYHLGSFFRSSLHDDCADYIVLPVAAQNA